MHATARKQCLSPGKRGNLRVATTSESAIIQLVRQRGIHLNELRSSRDTIVVIKIWGPLVCTVGALGVFGHDFPTVRFLPALPLLLFAGFQASLAVVKVADGVVRYRRLFKWKEIRIEEVVSAKAEGQPFIGSIQLRKPILPWGRLYFVLDKNTESNPFRRGEFPVLRCLIIIATQTKRTKERFMVLSGLWNWPLTCFC